MPLVKAVAAAPRLSKWVDLVDLEERLREMVEAIIKPATHYMPVRITTMSNSIVVTVAGVYYDAINERNLLKLITLKERSKGTVVVKVECFDGEHRNFLRGGGQYRARKAERFVAARLSGEGQPSAQTMLGKATRTVTLCSMAIGLITNGPAVAPRIRGIFLPPLARPAAAGAACLLPPPRPRPLPSPLPLPRLQGKRAKSPRGREGLIAFWLLQMRAVVGACTSRRKSDAAI